MSPADAFRVLLLAAAILLVLVVLRVAFLRLFGPPGNPQRRRSVPGLLSYAGWLSIAVLDGFDRFGKPLDLPRTVLSVLALGAGLFGAAQMVVLRRRGIRSDDE